MNIIENENLKERIVALAIRKSTGRPHELAHKLGVSERNVYRLIACLKDEGCPIKFSRISNSYLIE